nr:pyrophosphatase [Tanacetum cinerariifolium]
MQKIIKEQVKEQVKVQVSKILPRIEQTINEQLEAEVLTRSSNSSKTAYAVAIDLSEIELKKILIEKMKGNKSIHRSNEKRNLYQVLVEAYESDKIILDTYEETVTLKRCRNDDADKDEEPSAGPDRGSKRCREGKKPESGSAPTKTATRSAGRTINTTIDQQEAMDEALVPHAKRLRIGRSNFRLLSDIKSKESTIQLVYDVLRMCPFFKAFLVTADVHEIYMQEIWVTATVHHHAIRFKMDNKKHIVNLESLRDMLHICPMLPGQSFAEPPFEEEILTFIRFLGHSAAIRMLTDVNINKLYQPWRSFAVEHKDSKKSNEVYYLRFTKVIIHHFMSKDPLIPRRNKVNWHYVRDDHMFSTIKLVSRHQNTQQFDALLPIELTNEEIRNSNAYKEYYAVATGATPPKPKSSVQKTRSSSDTTITPPTAAGPRLTTSQKGKQAAKVSKAKNEGTGSIPRVPDVPTDESEEELSWNSTDEEGDDDEGKDSDDDEEDDGDDEEPRDEESFDPIPKTPEDTDDEGNGEEDLGLNVGREEGHDEDKEEDELYRDVNINQGRGIQTTQEVEDSHVTLTPVNPDGHQHSSSVSSQFVTSMLNLTLDAGMKSIFEMTSQMDVQTLTSMAPLPMSVPTINPSTIATITTIQHAPTLPTTTPSTLLHDLPNFGSLFGFDNKLRTLEANFFKFMQTNQFARAVSAIPGIIHRYMDQRMNEAVQVAVQLQSDKLREEAQKENDEFLKTIDENMQNHQGASQEEPYKALVEAYESNKIILDTYGDTVTLKRRRDDDVDKDEEPSAGPDQGSKRRREGKEPESASAPTKTATRSAGRSTQETKSRQTLASESATTEEPMQTTFKMEEPAHPEFEIGADDQPITKAADYGHIKWIEDLVPRTMWIQEQIGYDKHALWGVSHWGRKRQQFYGFAVNRESARDVYSKQRIIAVTKLKIVEWHNYNHLDWITRRVEDLQLGIESYQKKLNLTKPDTYRSDLKRKEAYIVYFNPRGFIYQNKDKKNRLMRIDELHKFSDGTLIDVRTALDDRLKGIQMQYLPQSIWRKSEKDRATAMIQAIDKRLKTRRIMRNLERPILTDLQVTPTNLGRMTKPYSSHRFIANCFNTGNLKMEVKAWFMDDVLENPHLPHQHKVVKNFMVHGNDICCSWNAWYYRHWNGATDAYGPICDIAGCIAEMDGMSHKIRERTDVVDVAGNTTTDVTGKARERNALFARSPL